MEPAHNPYASPEASEPPAATVATTLDAIAKATFLEWEKLRVGYVGVLLAETLVAGVALDAMRNLEFWLVAIAGGVFANVCFLAGPAVETYARWLGYRGRALRVAMFTAGLALTFALAWVALANAVARPAN